MLDSKMPLVRPGSTNYLLDLDMDEADLEKIISNAHKSHLAERQKLLSSNKYSGGQGMNINEDPYDPEEVMIGGGVLNEDNIKPTEEDPDYDSEGL